MVRENDMHKSLSAMKPFFAGLLVGVDGFGFDACLIARQHTN